MPSLVKYFIILNLVSRTQRSGFGFFCSAITGLALVHFVNDLSIKLFKSATERHRWQFVIVRWLYGSS